MKMKVSIINLLYFKMAIKDRCKHVINNNRCSNTSRYGIKPGHKIYCKDCATKYYPDSRLVYSPICSYNKLGKEICWKRSIYKKDTDTEKIRYCTEHFKIFGDNTFLKLKTKNNCDVCKKSDARKMITSDGKTMSLCKNCKDKKYPDARRTDGLCKKCTKHASCNYANKTTPIFCGDHKLPGMIEVKTKRCDFLDCIKFFGYINEDRSKLRCSEHKEEGMFSIKGTCIIDNCIRIPRFTDNKNSKHAKYCYEHSSSDMINVTTLCQKEDCFNKAQYGKCTTITHCKEHYDIETMKLVKYRKLCIIDGCNSTANLGKLFQPKIHCAVHKEPGEYHNNKPKCSYDNCINQPWYSDEGNFPKRCEEHKYNNDINVVLKNCRICKLEWLIADNNDTCDYCSNIGKSTKKKETTVKNFLESMHYNIVSYDRHVEGGCSLYRPDFIIDCGLFTVIVECDENAHKTYNRTCEENRMKQIHQDLYSDRYVIFIRYNPDSYKKKDGKPGRERDVTRLKMLDTLLQKLKKYDHMIEQGDDNYRPTSLLSAYYLYYDGFDKDNIEPINIDVI